MVPEQATAPLTHGSLALAQQPANVVEFKPRLSVVPEPVKGKSKAGKSKGKTISTKEECDWLKARFPRKTNGKNANWAITNSGAGFTVDFRIDKRYNNGEPINLKFPRISRATFHHWRTLSDEESRERIYHYVAAHLQDAIEQGDSRAGRVAGKLRAFA